MNFLITIYTLGFVCNLLINFGISKLDGEVIDKKTLLVEGLTSWYGFFLAVDKFETICKEINKEGE